MERHVWSGWLGWVLGDRDGVGEAAIRTHGNSYTYVRTWYGTWSEAMVGGHGMGASIDAALARV